MLLIIVAIYLFVHTPVTYQSIYLIIHNYQYFFLSLHFHSQFYLSISIYLSVSICIYLYLSICIYLYSYISMYAYVYLCIYHYMHIFIYSYWPCRFMEDPQTGSDMQGIWVMCMQMHQVVLFSIHRYMEINDHRIYSTIYISIDKQLDITKD